MSEPKRGALSKAKVKIRSIVALLGKKDPENQGREDASHVPIPSPTGDSIDRPSSLAEKNDHRAAGHPRQDKEIAEYHHAIQIGGTNSPSALSSARETSQAIPASQLHAYSSSPNPVKMLRDQLSSRKDRNVSHWGKAREALYIPEDRIISLVNESCIRPVLGFSGCGSDDSLVDFIVERARKLFALMILAESDGIADYMKFFRKHGYNDSMLLDAFSDFDKFQSENPGIRSYFDFEKLDILKSEKLWAGQFVRSEVEEKLREIFVPVLSSERLNHSFDISTTLPFLQVETESSHKDLSGAFSIVYQVKIHEGYLKGPNGEDLVQSHKNCFAVKSIRPTTDQREDLNKNWSNEVLRLKQMNGKLTDHILRCITGFTVDRGPSKDYHLLLEWADGGNLENLYKDHPEPHLDGKLIFNALEQMRGLVEALKITHQELIRHGDVKPGNILRFSPSDENIVGTLKIGDWGLAKMHDMVTKDRRDQNIKTTTNHGTSFYEAPEVETGRILKLLPRQYDVWSMGVVILETIIWLLRGYDDVNSFRDAVRHSNHGRGVRGRESCYAYRSRDGKIEARVDPVVDKWIAFLGKDDLCGKDSALGSLLDIVKNHLLVIETDPDMITDEDFAAPKATKEQEGIPIVESPQLLLTRPTINTLVPNKRYRAKTEDLLTMLDDSVFGEDVPESFWYRKRNAPPMDPRILYDGTSNSETSRLMPGVIVSSQDTSSSLGSTTVNLSTSAQSSSARSTSTQSSSTQSTSAQGSTTGLLSVHPLSITDYQHPKLDSEWTLHEDNAFAGRVLSRTKDLRKSQAIHDPETLCPACRQLDFFNTIGFSAEYTVSELGARQCRLCALILKAAEAQFKTMPVRIKLSRSGSHLIINSTGIPAISIVRDIDSKTRHEVRFGLPNVPTASQEVLFEILRQWLHLCDGRENHPTCQAARALPRKMPTRLIDVGEHGDEGVRVWEPGQDDACEYVAVSHPWGEPPHFVSDKHNIEDHRQHISIDDLPATFRDAVLTTRAIGIRHLWIDSICIIQGSGGDFHSEAGRMETVFSSAYCVLAASRARHQRDGFLGPRRERDYVTIPDGPRGARLYLCENIDAFDKHVLGGDLHKRGWVLQEHALARRTIFFTEHQTYWECGDGVRCETLTKMSNNLAAFLGDPKFPDIILAASQGEKIIRFQNLYKTYSKLDFTNAADRPIALSGIQKRLLDAYRTRGGYGVFDEGVKTGQLGLLRRSLLWYRSENSDLTRIDFPVGNSTSVPSWSWMAYTGEIDFLKPDFGAIDWVKIQSPWGSKHGETTPRSGDRAKNLALKAWAQAFKSTTSPGGKGRMILDSSTYSTTDGTLCVVLGVEKSAEARADRLHYFIVIRPKGVYQQPGAAESYERVGAGYLPGRCFERKVEMVTIC